MQGILDKITNTRATKLLENGAQILDLSIDGVNGQLICSRIVEYDNRYCFCTLTVGDASFEFPLILADPALTCDNMSTELGTKVARFCKVTNTTFEWVCIGDRGIVGKETAKDGREALIVQYSDESLQNKVFISASSSGFGRVDTSSIRKWPWVTDQEDVGLLRLGLQTVISPEFRPNSPFFGCRRDLTVLLFMVADSKPAKPQ